MKSGKVISVVIAGVLILVAIVLFINLQKNNDTFSILVVSYNGEKQEYKNIEVENVFVVNNVSFWIVSTGKDTIVLNSSDELYDEENNKTNEFYVKLKEDTAICFSASDCVHMNLE